MKKIRRYVYSFWHDPRTWQTDGQTDTAWRHRHRFARQKRKKMMTRALGKSQKRPGICDTVGALISYCLGCDRFASLMSSRWGNLCNANELFEWHIPLPVSGARITSLCRIVRMKLWSWRYDGRQIAKYGQINMMLLRLSDTVRVKRNSEVNSSGFRSHQNSYDDLSPVDCRIWDVMQDCLYQTPVRNVADPMQRLIDS